MAQDPRALLQKVHCTFSIVSKDSLLTRDSPRQIKHPKLLEEASAFLEAERRSMKMQRTFTHKRQMHFESKSRVCTTRTPHRPSGSNYTWCRKRSRLSFRARCSHPNQKPKWTRRCCKFPNGSLQILPQNRPRRRGAGVTTSYNALHRQRQFPASGDTTTEPCRNLRGRDWRWEEGSGSLRDCRRMVWKR